MFLSKIDKLNSLGDVGSSVYGFLNAALIVIVRLVAAGTSAVNNYLSVPVVESNVQDTATD